MIHVRPMTAADLALGLRLSEQAGWNQTEADWRRALDLEPDGCFVAEWDGVPAGTATTCLLGRVGWVALVLVDQDQRRHGIGRALLEHALADLDARGAASVRLDATPLGRPLYERLGFAAQFRLLRFEGVLPPASGLVPEIVPVPARRWGELVELDRTVTRTDRRKLLLRLFAERPDEVRAVQGRDGGFLGLMTARPGRRAVQLGPCLGEAGAPLLAEACRRHGGRMVYLDVPEDNAAAVRLVGELGMRVQRHLTRMGRGEAVAERIDLLWAGSGPEKG
jgi:ribosomal protein S18 acetylase RimI-like enzyme